MRSFSTAGKREAGWGKVKAYSDTQQRTDDLFFEYARLLEGIRPRVFVAENVSGLVKGTAKGYFKLVLAALRECGYRVEASCSTLRGSASRRPGSGLSSSASATTLACRPRSPRRSPTGTRCGTRSLTPRAVTAVGKRRAPG